MVACVVAVATVSPRDPRQYESDAVVLVAVSVPYGPPSCASIWF